MKVQALQLFAEKYNLNFHEGCVWGFFGRLPILTRMEDHTLLLNLGVVFCQQSGSRGMRELLANREFLDRYGVSYARVEEQMVQIDFPEKNDVVAQMEAMLLRLLPIIQVCDGMINNCQRQMLARHALTKKDQQIYEPEGDEIAAGELAGGTKEEQQYLFWLTDLKQRKEKKERGCFFGFWGAMAGSLIAAIPWMLVGIYDRFGSPLSFLIALAAMKGYNMTKSRKGTGRFVAVMISSMIGCVIAALGADLLQMYRLIYIGRIPGQVKNAPWYLWLMLTRSLEYWERLRTVWVAAFIFLVVGWLYLLKKVWDEKYRD